MADSTQQTIPFVSVEGCNKIIYLPAGIKVNYGTTLSQFLNPVLGGYYALTNTGAEGGTIQGFYVYTGSGFSKIGESTEDGITLTNDYNFLSLLAGQTQKNFNQAVSDKIQNLSLETNQTAQEIYLKDQQGNVLSTISIAFLNNEGTSFSYNGTLKTLELKNDSGEILASIPVSSFISNVGSTLEYTADQLKLKDKDGVVLSTVNIVTSDKLVKPTSLGDSATYKQAIVYNPATGLTAYINTSEFLKSIYSVDGSLTGARILNLNGFPFTFQGLSDKSADASFNSMLAINAAGQIAKSDGRVPMLKAAELFTDAQIDVWRQNMRKTGENYSTGVPRIDFILPFKLSKEIAGVQYFSVIGSNLLLNLSDFEVKLINISTNIEYPVSVVNTSASTTSQFSIGYNISTLPVGEYRIYVRNVNQTNIDNTTFNVVDALAPVNINSLNWTKNVLVSGNFNNSIALGGDIFRQSTTETGEPNTNVRKIEFLSDEILNASDANSSFIIEINFSRLRADIHYASYLGLVDSLGSDVNINLLPLFGWASPNGGGYRTILYPTSVGASGGGEVQQESGKIVISKKGSIIQMLGILGGYIYITTNISQTNSYSGLKLFYCDYGINGQKEGSQQTYNIKLYR